MIEGWGSEVTYAMGVEKLALLVYETDPKSVDVWLFLLGAVACPRVRDHLTLPIEELELNPGISQVASTAGESMSDPMVDDDDVKKSWTVGGSRFGVELEVQGDTVLKDLLDCLFLSLTRDSTGEAAVAAGKAVAVMPIILLRHMAIATTLTGGLEDHARGIRPIPAGLAPRAMLVERGQECVVTGCRREEALVTADTECV